MLGEKIGTKDQENERKLVCSQSMGAADVAEKTAYNIR